MNETSGSRSSAQHTNFYKNTIHNNNDVGANGPRQ